MAFRKDPLFAISLPLLLVLINNLHFSAAQNVVRAGYWIPDSGIEASAIDSTLFTHLFCAFADLNPQTYQVTVSSANTVPFSTFTNTVQQKNPTIKTLISIGGGNSKREVFSAMASRPNSRKAFIDSSIRLARSYGFHGLDLDWEYPNKTSDMSNMGVLFDEWRAAAVAESVSSGKPQLLLIAAVYYASKVYSLSYPVQAIGRSLDWINIMAYDFYDPTWYKFTWSHSALYDTTEISGSFGISDWVGAGLSSKKLVLGLPYYGYGWQLANPQNFGLKAPATGPATGLPFSETSGAIGYKRIKEFIQNQKATTVYNGTIVTNYCHSGRIWIGFDDVESVSAKVSFAREKGLLGYFAWHVANDDNWLLTRTASQAWKV